MNLTITYRGVNGLETDVVHVQPRHSDRSTLLKVDAQDRNEDGEPSGGYVYVKQLHDIVSIEVG